MKVFYPIAALGVGAVLGLTTGLALRKFKSHSIQPTTTADISHPPTSAGLRTGGSNKTRQDDSALATQLAHDLSMSTGVKRWLYWWDAIEKAAPSDFPRLARLAAGDRTATRLVGERWAELAPKQFFDALRTAIKAGNTFSPDLANILFGSWLKRDPLAVVAALNGEAFPGGFEWRRQVASSLIETDAEAGLKAMSQWHIENFGPNMKAIQIWAAADPRHAAEFALANPAGYASQEAIQTIAQIWAKADPAQGLDFSINQKGDLARKLSQTLLKSWAERDLNQAADWLANAGPSALDQFSSAFVEAWAKQDAASALTWAQSNLTGSTLADAMRGLFNGAAQKDPAAAASLVSAMDPSPARTQAAVAVASKWFPDGFDNKSIPTEVLPWLSGLDPNSIRKTVENIAWRWTEIDPSGLGDFLQSKTNVPFTTSVYNNLARSMARNDPAAALNWTGQLPETLGIGAGTDAFAEWGLAQPNAALDWLASLAASDPRRQPFLTGLLQNLAWDPAGTDRFAQVAATNPSTARAALKGMGLADDRRASLLARIPEQTAR